MLQEFDMEIRDKKGIENLIADHLSRIKLEKEDETTPPINENFPDEQLFALHSAQAPWYADFVNYLACGIISPGLSFQQKEKFFSDVKHYTWEDPYLHKHYADQMIRRCVPEDEMVSILHHCHSSEYGGYRRPILSRLFVSF